jgi:hypothetical protein
MMVMWQHPCPFYQSFHTSSNYVSIFLTQGKVSDNQVTVARATSN